MKNKIAIITCSNACLDYVDHPYDVKVFRSTLHIGDEDYVDYIDISAEEFYKRLKEDKSVFPSSSYCPIGKMTETYNELVDEGYTHCIVITISQGMSGTYNAAMMASKEVSELEVYVFDSKTVTYPQARMVLKACEMVEKNHTVPEILDELEYIRDNNKVYIAVNELTYLIKNGRLTNAQGFIANTLKIKPVLTVDNDGKVTTYKKIRTFKKALNSLLEVIDRETKNKNAIPYIVHANNDEAVDYLLSKLKIMRPGISDIPVAPITAVVGAHAGPGTVGIGYLIQR